MALFKRKMKYKINQGRSRAPQRARNVAITAAVLLVLLIGGGAIYTYLAGKDEQPDSLAAVTPDKDEAVEEFFEPKKPVKGEDVGVAVQFLTTPVRPGNNASINVRTTATAKCTISVTYDEVESEDTGLVPKQADKYGMVKWTWTVDETAPKGTWPVWVKCSFGGKSGEVRGDLQVDPEAEVL